MRRGIEQPSGTVTLVFTDIEGSTRLLEELGVDAYRAALAEHRRIVREACARHAGYEVDTEGDAFFYAFASAHAAVTAVTEAMQGLEGGPIRVRVGIHTGEPALDPPNYLGMDVHRAARIMATGHGGQVVLSPTTVALLQPGTVQLRDLGQHRLKDLSAPITLFQLQLDGLPTEFPPLKTLYRSNLPVPATPFLGREQELAQVVERLNHPDTRLLTLTGPGGTGKTRLALQAAAETADHFPDGIAWTPLAPLRDPALVLAALAEALAVKTEPGSTLVETLASGLAGRRLLLVIDNAEHLLPELAGALAEFRRAVPTATLLVTSRERLQLGGEQVYPVPSLGDQEGVGLFLERARSLGVDLDETPVVAQLCARLDNLPLALELAAARTLLFNPEQLLARLDDRLDLLMGGRDADPRQQTLRATIGWSHDLLDEQEQRVFRGLAVFVGGCTYDAAEAVAGASPTTLQSLLDKSLVRRSDETGSPRYWMLETIHEYARERLSGSGEAERVRNAHAAWFSTLAARAELRGREHSLWLGRLRAEHANMRATLAWLGERGRAVEELRLACDLGEYAYHSGALLEGRRWLDDALTHADGAPPGLRALTLAFSGLCALFQGDLEVADHRTEMGLDLARGGDDPLILGEALRARHLVLGQRGDTGAAACLGEEALEVSRASGLETLLADLANNMGYDALERGDLGRAELLLSESVGAGRARDDAIVLSISLSNVAILEFERGAYEAAAACWTEALRLARENSLGPPSLAALAGVEVLMAYAGALTASARVHGSVDRLIAETGEPLQGIERRLRDAAYARTRDALGASETERAVSAGWDIDTDIVAQEGLTWLEAFAANG